MAVDARINSISTDVSARDPGLVDDPMLVAAIVAKVLAELERIEDERRRRDADRRPGRAGVADRRGGR